MQHHQRSLTNEAEAETKTGTPAHSEQLIRQSELVEELLDKVQLLTQKITTLEATVATSLVKNNNNISPGAGGEGAPTPIPLYEKSRRATKMQELVISKLARVKRDSVAGNALVGECVTQAERDCLQHQQEQQRQVTFVTTAPSRDKRSSSLGSEAPPFSAFDATNVPPPSDSETADNKQTATTSSVRDARQKNNNGDCLHESDSALITDDFHKRHKIRKEENHNSTISADGKLSTIMDCVFVCIAIASALALVSILSPTSVQLRQGTPFYSAIIVGVFQVFTFFWMFLQFRIRTRINEWEVVDDLADIRRHYLRTWFAFDLLYAIPIEFVFMGWWNDAFYYSLCRHILRFVRVVHISRSNNPLLESRLWLFVLFFFGLCVFFVHLFATVFWAMHEVGNYSTAFYWAVATMTSTGYGDIVAETRTGRFTSCFLMVLGICMISIFTAVATSFLTTRDALKEELGHKKKMMYSMLNYYEIPWEVQKEVISLFPSVLNAESETNFRSMIRTLPPFVAETVDDYLRAKMLKNVPFFANIPDQEIVLTLAKKLRQRYAAPMDFIIFENDDANEMFFLVHGLVEVLARTQRPNGVQELEVIATLRSGAHFGEIALVEQTRRTASVQAVVGSELLILEKEDFDGVVPQSMALQEALFNEVEARKLQATILLAASSSSHDDSVVSLSAGNDNKQGEEVDEKGHTKAFETSVGRKRSMNMNDNSRAVDNHKGNNNNNNDDDNSFNPLTVEEL